MTALSLQAAALADAGRRLAGSRRRGLARAVRVARLAFWLVGALLMGFGLSWTTALDVRAARSDGGHAYLVPFRPLLGVLKASADEPTLPGRSRLVLLEDGRPLGPAHSGRARIRSEGGGAFSHWQDSLYVSASDGSDIRTNGRVYTAKATLRPGNSLRSGIVAAGFAALAAALWLAALNGLALRRLAVLLGAAPAGGPLG